MRQKYFFYYAALVLIQIVICNFLYLSPYVMLSVLPVIVLCIPTRFSTASTLAIAFVTALAVDLLAEGVVGLNLISLLPVAYMRRSLCDMIFGEDLILRNEDFSVRKYGIRKVLFAITTVQATFLLIYILADGGFARPFGFNALRFAASLASGIVLSVIVLSVIDSGRR